MFSALSQKGSTDCQPELLLVIPLLYNIHICHLLPELTQLETYLQRNGGCH